MSSRVRLSKTFLEEKLQPMVTMAVSSALEIQRIRSLKYPDVQQRQMWMEVTLFIIHALSHIWAMLPRQLSPIHMLQSSTTPNVKKLTISGRNEHVGGNHLDNNSMIRLYSNLSLGSDVVIKNIHLVESVDGVHEIDLSGHKLTLSGESVYMDSRVISSLTTSSLVTSTLDIAYIYGGVDVYQLTTGSVGVMLGADSRITYCYGNKIYVPQASTPSEKVKVTIVNQR